MLENRFIRREIMYQQLIFNLKFGKMLNKFPKCFSTLWHASSDETKRARERMIEREISDASHFISPNDHEISIKNPFFPCTKIRKIKHSKLICSISFALPNIYVFSQTEWAHIWRKQCWKLLNNSRKTRPLSKQEKKSCVRKIGKMVEWSLTV